MEENKKKLVLSTSSLVCATIAVVLAQKPTYPVTMSVFAALSFLLLLVLASIEKEDASSVVS